MASTLPSPAATPPPDSSNLPAPDPASSSSLSLSEKLDALLESYLILFDTYTTLRTQLSSQFSNGFFSLAHANRNAASVLGAGRRFGEDGYDQRMKALRSIKIEPKSDRAVDKLAERLDEKDNSNAEEEQRTGPEQNQQHEPHDSTPQPPTPSSPSTTTADEIPPPPPDFDHLIFTTFTTTTDPSSSTPQPKDPLKWFTALPPQPLRQTQSHFTSAVTTTIPSLLTTVSEMSAVEAMIWDVRGEMGMSEEYKSQPKEDADADLDAEEDEMQDEEGAPAVAKQKPSESETETVKANTLASLPSPTRKQNRVARKTASGPRSRVLKMD